MFVHPHLLFCVKACKFIDKILILLSFIYSYDDFLIHDVKIKLKPKGTLYLSIHKVGEIDDEKWWVKKARETIEKKIEEMVMTYVDKVIFIPFLLAVKIFTLRLGRLLMNIL